MIGSGKLIIGLVGKPNAGKSSILKALTLTEVRIANYPFTTIDPNIATGFVTTPCVCKELGVKCNPRNSLCVNGIRLVPVNLIDVAGLVPGAHEGRGLGNKFLDDLRQADCLIHVVDCSGKTDSEGNPCDYHDPCEDIKFLEEEIDLWFQNIIQKGLQKYERKIKHEHVDIIDVLTEQLAGLGITKSHVVEAMNKTNMEKFDFDNLLSFAKELRKISKPMLIAANKMDLPGAEENFEKLKKTFPQKIIVPCYAEGEVALKLAAKNGLVDYFPGDIEFKIKGELNEKQREALNKIKEFLDKWGSTGVQEVLNKAVFNLSKYIVVYPVENENKFTDGEGNVLPDAFLVPEGSTPRDLARRIHEDLEKNFICAIDARTKQKIPTDYKLKHRDVIKIMARV
jgi:hypothetical protein